MKKKLLSSTYEVWTHNGKNNTRQNVNQLIESIQSLGVGEVVLNFIDNDGLMNGFDFEAIKKFKKLVKVPLTVMGGAGSLDDLGRVVTDNGLVGVAAGSLFVFKGTYKAVLINYPNEQQKQEFVYGRCHV